MVHDCVAGHDWRVECMVQDVSAYAAAQQTVVHAKNVALANREYQRLRAKPVTTAVDFGPLAFWLYPDWSDPTQPFWMREPLLPKVETKHINDRMYAAGLLNSGLHMASQQAAGQQSLLATYQGYSNGLSIQRGQILNKYHDHPWNCLASAIMPR
jgi:hypothetical protein